MSTGTPGSYNGTEYISLVNGHAYTLLQGKQHGDLRLVQMRNPWGNEQYTGPYSDDSKLWTPELKKAFGYVKANDGKFWAPYEKFSTYFSTMILSKYNNNWKKETVNPVISGANKV